VIAGSPVKSGNTQNGIEPARPDSAVSDGYEFWSVQGKPVSIHLRSSVAGQIRAMADVQPVAGIPVENGGILWGRVRDVGEEYFIVSIEQADSIPCDHDRGEGWVPSQEDRRELKRHLKRKNGDLRPVGFWRSHRRRGLYLDKRDLDLMQVFFPHSWSVALCVRPPATAGFFIWENGDIRRTSSYREFQLPDAGQLAAIPLRPSSKPWKRWAAIGSLAAALAIAPFLLKSTDTTTPFNVLSMRAHTKPGVVRLSWDARSKLLRSADSAILWIADGSDESKLELTADQVKAGSIEYKPASPNVNFRMQVGQFMESLSVDATLPQGSPPIVAVTQPPPQPPTEPAPERYRNRKAPRTMASRKVELPSPVRQKFEPPSAPEVPSPPQISVPPRLERPNLPQRNDDVPKVSATLEKPGSSPLKKVFGWMVPGRNKDFVPAKPVRQYQPQFSSEEPVSIAVRVEIDQRGIVRDADLVTKRVDGPLGRAAIAAAKRWRFEPAREKDRPVASSMVVKFSFGGEKDR
jgi:periplasmic protein TonB